VPRILYFRGMKNAIAVGLVLLAGMTCARADDKPLTADPAKYDDATAVRLRLLSRLEALGDTLKTMTDAELDRTIAALKSADESLSKVVPDSQIKEEAKKLGDLDKLSREGEAKGNLGSVRSALSIYYGDHDGAYPKTLDELVPKYLPEIPKLELPDHKRTAAVRVLTEYEGGSDKDAQKYVKDTGGWLYLGGPESKSMLWGTVLIDCSHKDHNGKVFSEF
jgi:hypothetical protein